MYAKEGGRSRACDLLTWMAALVPASASDVSCGNAEASSDSDVLLRSPVQSYMIPACYVGCYCRLYGFSPVSPLLLPRFQLVWHWWRWIPVLPPQPPACASMLCVLLLLPVLHCPVKLNSVCFHPGFKNSAPLSWAVHSRRVVRAGTGKALACGHTVREGWCAPPRVARVASGGDPL